MALYKPQIKTDLGVEDLDLFAEKANKDGDGNVITSTYATQNTLKNTGVFTAMSVSSIGGSTNPQLSVRWYVSGIEGITAPFNGMKIAIKIPRVGTSTAGAILSLNGNVNDNYHPVLYNASTMLTNHFPVDSIKTFIYDANASANCYKTSGTVTSVTGVWKAESDYNSSSFLSYTAGAVSSGTTKNYIIGKQTVASDGTNKYNANVYFENNGTLNAPTLSEGGTALSNKYLQKTEVVANPTLSGGEADLTSLQVGDTKYAIPSGGGTKKYLHNFYIKYTTSPNYLFATGQLVSSTSGAYTSASSLWSDLNEQGFNASNKFCNVTGKFNTIVVMGIRYYNSTQFEIQWCRVANSSYQSEAPQVSILNVSSCTIVSDVVQEI